jgi:hypothetical protein
MHEAQTGTLYSAAISMNPLQSAVNPVGTGGLYGINADFIAN